MKIDILTLATNSSLKNKNIMANTAESMVSYEILQGTGSFFQMLK